MGSIGDVGVHITPYDLHKTVHAMVASLFESVMGLPSPVDDFDRLSQRFFTAHSSSMN